MIDWMPTTQFEENVRLSFGVPEIRSEFVKQLLAEINQRASDGQQKTPPLRRFKPVWTAALVLLSIVLIVVLAMGPQRVYAAFQQLFGYIPGVGIVDQSSSLRVLAEPVSLTREGVTVSVDQVILTGTETRLNFGVSGVPLSAYPKEEAVTGCIQPEYLRLPDGTQLNVNEPIPANVDEATFILPCIFNTLPGTVPTDWELPLRFIEVPPDFTIIPVMAVTTETVSITQVSEQETAVPAMTATTAPLASVSVEKVIETEDGYILLGYVHPHIPEGSWLQITGAAVIRDADGKPVSYTFPMDIQRLDDSSIGQGGGAWAMQFKGAGVNFPITISFSGIVITRVDSQATGNVTIDVGTDPQPEQVWEVNQEVQLAGNSIRLVSITAQSSGYSFRIDPGENLISVDVQIEGHQAVGGGGGGGMGGVFSTSLAYDINDFPKGQLIILFSNPRAASQTETWQTTWKPEKVKDFSDGSGLSTACFNADSITSVPFQSTKMDGFAVLTQMNPQLQVVIARMDESVILFSAQDSARAALSLDGTMMAYTTKDGIVILNLVTGNSSINPGSFGRDLHWSPDGKQLTVVNAGDVFGIFMLDSEGISLAQLSNLGTESIAGWSPDGSTLYYAIPGSTGNGFLLRSVEVQTGITKDMFVLENSSRKAPLPAVSPDGKWVAYRAVDNSSLYIKGMDGSPARLVLDNPAVALNGIAWEKESHWLGVSLITKENHDGEIFLLDPNSCEAYRLKGLSGELDAIYIP